MNLFLPNIKTVFLVFLCILIGNTINAQRLGDEIINQDQIRPWIPSSIEAYEGMYNLGFSEAESQLTIAVDGDQICMQLISYEWLQENEERIGWYPKYTNPTLSS